METRRDFLRNLGMLGVALAGRQILIPEQAYAQTDDDFTLVKRLPRNNLLALDKALIPSKVQLNSQTQEVNLEVGRFPQVVYSLTAKLDENEGIGSLSTESLGSLFVLNPQGFFVSAYHVFDEYLNRERNHAVMMAYDPILGLACAANPLIYSEKYDILLGQLETRKGFENVQETTISATDMPVYGMVYSTYYEDIDKFWKFLKKISESGEWSYLGDDTLRFTQTHPVKMARKEERLPVCVALGNIAEIKSEDGTQFTGEGEYAFLANINPGNSGSPVFDLENRLMGIMIEKMTEKDISDNEKRVGIYTGPHQIRRMIQAYINHCV